MSLPCVGRILLERETVDGQFLAAHTSEEILHDHLSEPFTLPIVDLDHLQPVLGHRLQFQRFGQVDQIVNVLLKATATETFVEVNNAVTGEQVDDNYRCWH